MEEGTLDKSRSQVVTRQVMYQMHDTIQCGHGTHITGSRSCPSPTVGISAVRTEGTGTYTARVPIPAHAPSPPGGPWQAVLPEPLSP